MKQKDFDKLTSFLRDGNIPHVLVADVDNNGQIVSCLCDGNEFYSFLDALIEVQPFFKEVIETFVKDMGNSVTEIKTPTYLN